MFGKLKSELPAELSGSVEWGAVECFAQGCMAEALYRDAGAYKRVSDVLGSFDSPLGKWERVVHLTAPEPVGDKVVVTVALMPSWPKISVQ